MIGVHYSRVGFVMLQQRILVAVFMLWSLGTSWCFAAHIVAGVVGTRVSTSRNLLS